jgi:hypothetical protein
MPTNIYDLARVRDALQLLVNYLEADPDLYDGDDDGALNQVMCNAHAALNLWTHHPNADQK